MHCYAPNFDEVEWQIGLGLLACPSIYPTIYFLELGSYSSPTPTQKNYIWIQSKNKSLTPAPPPPPKKKKYFLFILDVES